MEDIVIGTSSPAGKAAGLEFLEDERKFIDLSILSFMVWRNCTRQQP